MYYYIMTFHPGKDMFIFLLIFMLSKNELFGYLHIPGLRYENKKKISFIYHQFDNRAKKVVYIIHVQAISPTGGIA